MITKVMDAVYCQKLYDAIKHHAAQRGDRMCWMDDHKLYELLPEHERPIDKRMLPPLDMISNCVKYVRGCHDPSKPYYDVMDEIDKRDKRIAELEEELKALRRKHGEDQTSGV